MTFKASSYNWKSLLPRHLPRTFPNQHFHYAINPQFSICISRDSLRCLERSKCLGDSFKFGEWTTPRPTASPELSSCITKINLRVIFHFTSFSFFLLFFFFFKFQNRSNQPVNTTKLHEHLSTKKRALLQLLFQQEMVGLKMKAAQFLTDLHIFQVKKNFPCLKIILKWQTHFSMRQSYQKVTNYHLKRAKSCDLT